MNLYEVLEVAPDVDDETLRHAITHQSAIWSERIPMAVSVQKRHEAENMLHRLAEAKHLLLDPDRRRAYNNSLDATNEASVPMELRPVPTEPLSNLPPRRRATDEAHAVDRGPCPYCGELVLRSAKKCRWCNEWLEEQGSAPVTQAGNPAEPLIPRPTAHPQTARSASTASKQMGALAIGLAVIASTVYWVTRENQTPVVQASQGPAFSASAPYSPSPVTTSVPSKAPTLGPTPSPAPNVQSHSSNAHSRTLNAMVTETAKDFLGRPTLTSPLDKGKDGQQEALVTGTQGFDCVTFVESSVALARAKALGDSSEAEYARQLERLRYRHGVRDGYASRLHYFSEWVSDNAARGNVVDITADLGGQADTRPLDFMTTHRPLYAKLHDEGVFTRLQAAETEASRKPRMVLPKAQVASILARLESGDILAVTTDIPGLDVVHTGIVIRQPDGSVHLMHALPGGAVTVSRLSLVDYLKVYKEQRGVIIARPLAPAPASNEGE
jgi:hypothetical protein